MSAPVRLAVIATVVLATIVLAVVFASRFGTDPTLSPSPLLGKPAPDVELDLIESDEVLALRDLEGQFVVLNFWAPWCVPCRAEHAVLMEAASQYGGLGVVVVGAVYQSDESAVTAFLDELGRGYPVGMDERSRAAIGFGVRGVPETYFIGRDGSIVGKVSGPVTRELLDRVILGDLVEASQPIVTR